MLDQITIYSATLFACCMACHGELARSKPHPQYLTHFFLLISAGGALGGLFVAIIATRFFLGYWEYQIGLVASIFTVLVAWCTQRVWLNNATPAFWIWACITAAQTTAIYLFFHEPLADDLESFDRHFIYGIYSLGIVMGLILTIALESKRWVISSTWLATSLLQLAWLGICSSWYFSESAMAKLQLQPAVSLLLPTLIGLAAFWFVTSRSERGQLISMRVLLVASVAASLTAFWYLDWFASWKIQLFAGACIAALAVEGIVRRWRTSASPSWGFWFWIPITSLLGLLTFQLIDIIKLDSHGIAHLSRNFYGVLKVRFEDIDEDDDYSNSPRYILSHGQIEHGFQFTDEYWKRQPTTYYGADSGIGLAIRLSTTLAKDTDQHDLHVGIVGLGAGSLAAYGQPGQRYRFYEINPDVIALSGKYFTYLNDSPADTQVILGDARIEMEREIAAGQNQQFDVLAIDAFSSDAIPVHLLTAECGQVYRQHLRPGGILALHISNRFLDLAPVSRGLADSLGWQAIRIDNEDDDSTGVYGSTWILITDNESLVKNEELNDAHWPWEEGDKKLLWTDDYSGLWQILTF
jgi:hypothetical protein